MSKRTERREPTTNWKRGCYSKVRYHDREQAKRMRQKCKAQRPGTELRIYECWCCGGFHLTHVHAQPQAVKA